MVFGCDGYAPIVLPSTAEVLLPDGSKHVIRGFAREERLALAAPSAAMTRALQAISAIRDPDPYIVSLVRDHVWWRRVAYFALLASTILVVLLPFIVEPFTELAKRTGDSTAAAVGAGSLWTSIWNALVGAAGSITAVLTSVLALIGSIIPGYAKPWIDGLTTGRSPSFWRLRRCSFSTASMVICETASRISPARHGFLRGARGACRRHNAYSTETDIRHDHAKINLDELPGAGGRATIFCRQLASPSSIVVFCRDRP